MYNVGLQHGNMVTWEHGTMATAGRPSRSGREGHLSWRRLRLGTLPWSLPVGSTWPLYPWRLSPNRFFTAALVPVVLHFRSGRSSRLPSASPWRRLVLGSHTNGSALEPVYPCRCLEPRSQLAPGVPSPDHARGWTPVALPSLFFLARFYLMTLPFLALQFFFLSTPSTALVTI